MARVVVAVVWAIFGFVPAPVAVAADHDAVALRDPLVAESSGLASSVRQPGILWTHNDSGGEARLFATDAGGAALARVTVAGAENVDWEDLALGPDTAGEAGAALYIADTGDNALARETIVVYRVPEPSLPDGARAASGPVETTSGPAEAFAFRYPDGPHDAEALLVHPVTAELLIVTKDGAGTAGVYRAPRLDAASVVTLERAGELTTPGLVELTRMVTGGAVSPEGDLLTVRTYLGAYEWEIAPGGTMADALRAEPRSFALPLTRQGEAIAYTADGSALWATSEGSPCPLLRVDRR